MTLVDLVRSHPCHSVPKSVQHGGQGDKGMRSGFWEKFMRGQDLASSDLTPDAHLQKTALALSGSSFALAEDIANDRVC